MNDYVDVPTDRPRFRLVNITKSMMSSEQQSSTVRYARAAIERFGGALESVILTSNPYAFTIVDWMASELRLDLIDEAVLDLCQALTLPDRDTCIACWLAKSVAETLQLSVKDLNPRRIVQAYSLKDPALVADVVGAAELFTSTISDCSRFNCGLIIVSSHGECGASVECI